MDTRLRQVSEQQVDAVVLARAGLSRLGRLDEITQTLDPGLMLPAPGQGALAVEGRADRAEELATALAGIDDPVTRAAVTAERTVLTVLEAGCTAPVGALAEVIEGELELSLRAVVVDIDGHTAMRGSATGLVDDPDALGRQVAAALLEAGAASLVGADTRLSAAEGVRR